MFVGPRNRRSKEGIFSHQQKYAQDIISDTRLENANIAFFPFAKGLKLNTDT